MMEPAQAPRLIIPSKASAIGRFGKFKNESGQDVRAPLAKKDPTLERFMDIWQRVECREYDEGPELFERAQKIAEDFKCSADDIRRFTILLRVYAPTEYRLALKAGTLLSVLMGNSDDAGFVIPLRDISIPLHFIGTRCSKRIVVDGDTGDFAGDNMIGGSLVVRGNVDGFAGCGARGTNILIEGDAGRLAGVHFSGGSLRIEGNAGEELGGGMKGGMVYVRGDAGAKVGDQMRGGIIRVDGEIESIGDVEGGKIFHKGKLIFDKPDVK